MKQLAANNTKSDWLGIIVLQHSLSSQQAIQVSFADEEAVIDENHSWYFSKKWQQMEKEADEDLKSGNFTVYSSMSELLNDLD